MTDNQAFLESIRSKPDDDLPRLVFADWLDENGEHEWGEFIRVQVEIARIFPGTACVQCGRKSWERPNVKYCGDGSNKDYSHRYETSEEMKSLRKRAEELWIPPTSRSVSKSAHTVGLATVILDGQPNPGSAYRSWGIARRGFIEEIRCPMATWMKHGPKIVRLPTAAVRKVVVTDRSCNDNADGGYLWFDDTGASGLHPASDIPEVIFSKMECGTAGSNGRQDWRMFDSPGLANAAISEACLSWAWVSEPAVNV